MPHDECKFERCFFIIFAIFGLIVLIIGAALSTKMLIFDRIGKETTYARITNITNSSTSVEYTVKNKIYRRTYTVYNSSYYVGKEAKIRYNKVNPNKSCIASMQYLILIVPFIGLVFTGIGGIGLIHIYMKYYKI